MHPKPDSVLLPPPTYTHAEVRDILAGISADAKKYGLEVVDKLNGTLGLRPILPPPSEKGNK